MLACTAETASGDLDWIVDDHVELEDEFCSISIGEIFFLHVRRTSRLPQDAMGSVIGMADGSGASTASIKYDAFGNVTSSSGSAAAIPSSVGTDFRYHGMQLDVASGLYHVRARTYDARTGRFTSRDPLTGKRSTVETWHPYVFAANSPHVYIDPNGQSILTPIIVVTIVAILASYAINKWGDTYRRFRELSPDKRAPSPVLYIEHGVLTPAPLGGEGGLGLHSSIGVGDPFTEDVTWSFGAAGFREGGLYGEVYQDMTPGGAIQKWRPITEGQADQIRAYLESLEGEEGDYNLITNNCNNFVDRQWVFLNDALDAAGDGPLDLGGSSGLHNTTTFACNQ